MKKDTNNTQPMSVPKTPKSGGVKGEKTDDKESDKEKKKKAEQLKAIRKTQEQDMPRFEKGGETEIKTVKDSYEICAELGRGSFGAVFSVIRQSDQQIYALKCESVHMKRAMLPYEATALIALNMLKSPHFVEMIDRGIVENRFLFVVMKCVGRNLWDIRMSLEDRRYTLPTILKIAEQTLAGLRDLHRVGYLHRDIKPPNFAAGRDGDVDYHTIYILDFGLCRRIATKGKDLRIPRVECAFRGTTRYASLAAHEGKEQSRKDDLESWWYMISEMINHDIPWKQLRNRDEVAKVKNRLREDENFMKKLFNERCYPEMKIILNYLDQLVYTSIPDYDFVFNYIRSCAVGNKFNLSAPPDWDPTAKEYRGPVYKFDEPYIVKALE